MSFERMLIAVEWKLRSITGLNKVKHFFRQSEWIQTRGFTDKQRRICSKVLSSMLGEE